MQPVRLDMQCDLHSGLTRGVGEQEAVIEQDLSATHLDVEPRQEVQLRR